MTSTAQRRIRRYQPADLERVVVAWETASAVGHPFLSVEFLATERRLLREVYMPNGETYVLEHDGEVIGFLSMNGNEVAGLFVEAAQHGTGAGRALMDHAKSLHDDLVVEVFQANSVGRRFYEKAGFVYASEYFHDETEHVMLRMTYTPVNHD